MGLRAGRRGEVVLKLIIKCFFVFSRGPFRAWPRKEQRRGGRARARGRELPVRQLDTGV